MALNDLSMRAQGTDVYPNVANPTESSSISDPMATNFVDDPTRDERGAGAPSDFMGHREAKRAMNEGAGVIEARPGILDDTNIDPLNENSNKDDGWTNATQTPGSSATQRVTEKASETVTSAQKADRTDIGAGATGALNSAMGVATGAVQMAYGAATGNQQYVERGKENVFGERRQ